MRSDTASLDGLELRVGHRRTAETVGSENVDDLTSAPDERSEQLTKLGATRHKIGGFEAEKGFRFNIAESGPQCSGL